MLKDASQKTALIIGASRGLGFGLAKELLTRGWNVTATVRSAPKNSALLEFHGQVALDTVDINNRQTVDPFVARIKLQVFDVVFINAGIGGPDGKTAETAEPEEIMHLFMTNAVSPVRLAYKLLDNVKSETGILAFMSSVLGSVERNDHGTVPLYSASKAALNQLTRGFAAGLGKDITVLSLHPGWVKTDMGGPHADIDIATSVKGLADLLDAKVGSNKHEFLDYQGNTLPW